MKNINFNKLTPKYKPMISTNRQAEVGERLGRTSKDQVIKFTIELKPKTPQYILDEIFQKIMLEHCQNPLAAEISRADHARLWSADLIALNSVRQFAANFGFKISDESLLRRQVDLLGTVAQIEEAFGTRLHSYKEANGNITVQRNGPLEVPLDLSQSITGIFGIDSRNMLDTFVNRGTAIDYKNPVGHDSGNGRSRSIKGYYPDLIARAYGVSPVNPDRACEKTICLIELGGGYSRPDYLSYCRDHGYTPGRLICATADGATNNPGVPSGADGEVMLDICVAVGTMPGITLLVIFAENTEQGFIKALKTALHHPLHPSAISISWGGPENTWTYQAITSIRNVVKECVIRKIKVLTASGDNEAADGAPGGGFTVDFPSALDLAWSCGGTHVNITNGRITSERVWGCLTDHCTGRGAGTGGGVSRIIARPEWQNCLVPSCLPIQAGTKRHSHDSTSHHRSNRDNGMIPGRMCPDWAFSADPEAGWIMRNTDGREYIIGGTSAVAPFCAAALASVETQLTIEARAKRKNMPELPAAVRLPASPAWLYQLWKTNPSIFRDVTRGSNGYAAKAGYDLCTGLGSFKNFAALADSIRESRYPMPKVA